MQRERAVCAATSQPALSNDVHMSDDESPGVNGSRDAGGVFGNLPRTRPQRSSSRRAAARDRAPSRNGTRKPSRGRRASAGADADASRAAGEQPMPQATTAPALESAPTAASDSARAAQPQRGDRTRRAATGTRHGAARPGAKRARPAATEEPAPRQGYESDSESARGSVQPPGGVELVTSAAELVGELTKAGLSSGERVLKDVLARLPLP
jgi:hypothetical protein